MKTKKLLAILLSALMVMSLCISASAIGDRTTQKTLLSKEVETFTDAVIDGSNGNFGTGSANTSETDLVPDAATTISVAKDGENDYLKSNLTATSSGVYAVRVVGTKAIYNNEPYAFGTEFKFRIPSKLAGTETANSTSSTLDILFSNNLKSRDRFVVAQLAFGASAITVKSGTTSIATVSYDKWYTLRIEAAAPIAMGTSDSITRWKTILSESDGRYIGAARGTLSGVKSALKVVSFGDNAKKGPEFHLDDYKLYYYTASEFNFGAPLFREDFSNYVTIDESITGEGAKYSYGWTETNNWNGKKRAISMVFGNVLSAGETKRVNAITDEGSTDKFFRVKATVDNADYIQFRLDTVAQLTELDNATKSYADAIVFGSKIRIDDTSKDNAIELWTKTVNYTAADETVYPSKEAQFVLIEPDIKAVTIGKDVTFGLDMKSDVWYDLKLYVNDSNGYGRLEVTDTTTGKTQIFEGKYEIPTTYDLSSVLSWGYVTRFAQANTVDYDELTLDAWNPSAASMAKVYDASAITLSKEAIEAGEIKATVDVTGYSQAKDITTEVANLVFVSYEGDRLSEIEFVGVKPNTYTAEATLTIPEEGAENYKVKAMLWGEDMSPIVESAALGAWE